MAEDIKNVNIEEEEEDIITLEFDDDTAVDCYVMGTFELNGKEYIALAPEDGTDDVYKILNNMRDQNGNLLLDGRTKEAKRLKEFTEKLKAAKNVVKYTAKTAHKFNYCALTSA